MEFADTFLDSSWKYLKDTVPLTDHILFPSIVALGSFHLHCWLFTLYDVVVLKRSGIKQMIRECAIPQSVAHALLNGLSFYFIHTRKDLPEHGPTAIEFVIGLVLCYFIGDFLIYHEHVLMHKIPFLRHNIHATHHRFTSPMYSFNAGWVHPIEILVAAVCELAFPLAAGVHPLTLWVFLWTWVFWLVEEHSGDDVWWSLWHLFPLVGGGAPPHNLHHAPHLTKNFGFVFSCWDRMFGTFQEPNDTHMVKKQS